MTTRTFAAIAGLVLLSSPAITRAQDPGATIRGRIVADDTGQPLRRAMITLRPDGGGPGQAVANTSVDGRYEIPNVRSGTYHVTAARSGYVSMEYGQTQWLERPRLIEIAPGTVIEDVNFRLPPMATISGRITDERGDPVPGVTVAAMGSTYVEGRRQWSALSAFTRQTDDTGAYSMTPLPPGSYVISAFTRDTWPRRNGTTTETMAFRRTYAPGTADPDAAQVMTVKPSDRVRGVDFSLLPVRTVTVSGKAVDSSGEPLKGRQIGLTIAMRGPGGGAFTSAGNDGKVGDDGRFVIRNVPPGEYKLQARGPSSKPGAPEEAAAVTITVDDKSVEGIVIRTMTGWSIAGRIVGDDGQAPPFPGNRTRMTVSVPDATNPRNGPPGGRASVNGDWTFTVSDLFGPARLALALPAGWTVRAIRANARDVTDVALDMPANGQLTGVEMVITNRVTSVGGQVLDERGTPRSDSTVVVYASDADKWGSASRFVRGVRPDDRGAWKITGLPPGDYLASALDYVQDGAWTDPEFLARARTQSQPVRLADGASQSLTLTVSAAVR